MMGLYRTIAISSTLLLYFILYCLPSLAQTEDKYYTRADLFKRPSGGFTLKSAVNKTTLNKEEKQKILDLHNAYRSIVMPSARDMAELAWDDDLEAFAINHTQVCTAHRYSIEEAVYMFWEEGSGYHIETHTCTHKHTCGHYRVVVDSRSNRIGCAINICEKFSISRYPTPAVFFQCVYNGAFLNSRRPYKVGPVCIDCNRQTLGYLFQFCRNRLCISPQLRIAPNGFDGNTSIVGLDYRKVPFITKSSMKIPKGPPSNSSKKISKNSSDRASSASFNVKLYFFLFCFNVFIFKTQ